MLLELDGVRFLTDPVLRDRVGPLMRTGPTTVGEAAHEVDGVLLSHLHADHADLPSLRRCASRAEVFGPLHAGQWLARHGIPAVRELAPRDEATFRGLRIAATPAVHDHRRWPLGPVAEPIGYVVRGSGSVYFAGDTDLFDAMSQLRGSIDLALLPVWGWGTSLGPGHLDPERAARAAALIAPAVAIPIHWGTFALFGRAPPDPGRPALEFADLVARYAPDVEVRVLRPGESTLL